MDRHVETILLEGLKKWRCGALLGPRQVGKSYLLKKILKTVPGVYLSFDDPLVREEAAKDPVPYLKRHYQPGKYLFIDEAAKVPEIFSAVKVIVDHLDSAPSGICLANSSNYLLLKRVKETLAGRVHLLSMYPISWQELSQTKAEPGLVQLMAGKKITPSVPRSLLEIERAREERLLWGGYPIPVLDPDPQARIQWGEDYLRTYVLPLVVEQFKIRDILAFEKAARILLAQNAQIFNVSKLASLIGVSQPTADSYAHQLVAMMVIDLLPVYLKNPVKRLAKQPKLYVVDPLLCHIALGSGFSLQRSVEQGRIGALYESFVINEIKKAVANAGGTAEFFTWRTQDKAEVDLVLMTTDRVIPFEIKWSKKIASSDLSGLNSFLDDYPNVAAGFVVHPGGVVEKVSDKIWAIPDWWLLGCP